MEPELTRKDFDKSKATYQGRGEQAVKQMKRGYYTGRNKYVHEVSHLYQMKLIRLT
jgi:hypothetical protein